ncbi:hypothetical protein HK098_002971 [Nowakowskiella sp. JEL0407]|nr:hypothetical protein HK098_002971 [Nowakowskiella sp. JEL0407]
MFFKIIAYRFDKSVSDPQNPALLPPPNKLPEFSPAPYRPPEEIIKIQQKIEEELSRLDKVQKQREVILSSGNQKDVSQLEVVPVELVEIVESNNSTTPTNNFTFGDNANVKLKENTALLNSEVKKDEKGEIKKSFTSTITMSDGKIVSMITPPPPPVKETKPDQLKLDESANTLSPNTPVATPDITKIIPTTDFSSPDSPRLKPSVEIDLPLISPSADLTTEKPSDADRFPIRSPSQAIFEIPSPAPVDISPLPPIAEITSPSFSPISLIEIPSPSQNIPVEPILSTGHLPPIASPSPPIFANFPENSPATTSSFSIDPKPEISPTSSVESLSPSPETELISPLAQFPSIPDPQVSSEFNVNSPSPEEISPAIVFSPSSEPEIISPSADIPSPEETSPFVILSPSPDPEESSTDSPSPSFSHSHKFDFPFEKPTRTPEPIEPTKSEKESPSPIETLKSEETPRNDGFLFPFKKHKPTSESEVEESPSPTESSQPNESPKPDGNEQNSPSPKVESPSENVAKESDITEPSPTKSDDVKSVEPSTETDGKFSKPEFGNYKKDHEKEDVFGFPPFSKNSQSTEDSDTNIKKPTFPIFESKKFDKNAESVNKETPSRRRRFTPRSSTNTSTPTGDRQSRFKVGTNIVIDFKCDAVTSAAGCNSAKETFRLAGEIISRTIVLTKAIFIKAEFISFCKNSADGCGPNSKPMLGQATATSYWTIHDVKGVDENFWYPQALAKQLVPSNATMDWSTYDILAQFNSDTSDGASLFWFPDNTSPISRGQYDFLYVVLHELIHGLGFVSSWGTYFETSNDNPKVLPMLTPLLQFKSRPLVQNNGLAASNVVSNCSALPPYIFDKFLITGKNEAVSLQTVYQQMNESGVLNDAWVVLKEPDTIVKSTIKGAKFQAGLDLYDSATTPGSIRFQGTEQSGNTVVLHTTYDPFRVGSSLSHFDQRIYEKTADFLMRPEAPSGITLRKMIADTSGNQNATASPIGPKTRFILGSLGYKLMPESTASQYGLGMAEMNGVWKSSGVKMVSFGKGWLQIYMSRMVLGGVTLILLLF